MELPKTVVKSTRNNPRMLTIFGQSKVGKTTILSELKDCLIIDTEQGTDLIDAMKVNTNSMKEFVETYKALVEEKKTNNFQYKYIAIDTIDNLVGWIEASVKKEHAVRDLIDIPFGAGYNAVRIKTMQWLRRIKNLTPHLILVGHRKKTISDDSATVSVSSLELSGKLKNMIMADSDAIGYIFRTTPEAKEDETLQQTAARSEIKVSFVANDELEAGARQPHLRGKILPFKWDEIFID